MMSKIDTYRQALRTEADWDVFLTRESGLPGPRGNLELAQAAADEGDAARFARWAALEPAEAPENTPEVFLVFCGLVGLGRLLADGQGQWLPLLRRRAADPRWRVREAVAMGLQRWGAADMPALLAAMGEWAHGSHLEQRAAMAALCEPALLKVPEHARAVLGLLDVMTASVAGAPDRKAEGFKVLRQGLAYGWSVAVAALPAEGKAAMERWLSTGDKDVRWIMRENLKKNRLARLDPGWVEAAGKR
jgi:hypothetical protein